MLCDKPGVMAWVKRSSFFDKRYPQDILLLWLVGPDE